MESTYGKSLISDQTIMTVVFQPIAMLRPVPTGNVIGRPGKDVAATSFPIPTGNVVLQPYVYVASTHLRTLNGNVIW